MFHHYHYNSTKRQERAHDTDTNRERGTGQGRMQGGGTVQGLETDSSRGMFFSYSFLLY
jgi:hypothetical protein